MEVADLLNADAVFTTNSVGLIVNVAEIETQPLPEAGRVVVDALRRESLVQIEAECCRIADPRVYEGAHRSENGPYV